MDSAALDVLSARIIGCAIAVHRVLGPGLLESIYRDCLSIELKFQGLAIVREHAVPIYYRGERARDDLTIDIVVDDVFVVEVKAVERLHPVHQAQVISYLKLTGCPAAKSRKPPLDKTRVPLQLFPSCNPLFISKTRPSSLSVRT